MCCQNLPQIQNRYPDNLWAELIGNADTQLMLGCTDDVTAEYFSARSGDMTVEVNSTMTVRQSIAIAQIIPQYRYTEGLGRRRLLTPDEVLRLPNEELLIIIRGQKVLRARKFDYTGHPYARECVKASIQDYRQFRSAPDEEPAPLAEQVEDQKHPAAEQTPEPVPQQHHKPVRRKPTLYESSRPPVDF